ncbi:MAG: twin-arginine translocase subunit TatB [Altererythrobacter sp.]|nr:twin-arginine translocase subunit TatB [Altererythrobacter sp.]NNF93313.1 twin-arginine translocase subunit TatB [Altererythrobacter sp.]
MFDIGAAELLVIVVVAIIVIGPKDMPRALRTAGSWIGKVRKVSAHFRSGIDTMIRESELEEMEAKWKARNEEIMARTGAGEQVPEDEMTGPPAVSAESAAVVEPAKPKPPKPTPAKPKPPKPAALDDPQLPLDPPKKGEGE